MSVTIHTHESDSEGGVLDREVFAKTFAHGSFAGSLGTFGTAFFALSDQAFMPMVYVSSKYLVWVGHSTDAVDPDSSRFGLLASQGFSGSYAVDYRYKEAL